jgi:hypothetical protein
VVTVAVSPAAASAGPYLSSGEAKREIGRSLHRSAKYGAETGSLIAFCGRRSWSVVRCDILFRDWDGDTWCGWARVRETWSHYWVSWRVGTRGCEYF